MIYLQLFWEFFQIGLFAVGGGMANLNQSSEFVPGAKEKEHPNNQKARERASKSTQPSGGALTMEARD